MKACVITPVYEDIESAKILLENIHIKYGSNYHIVIIDDGSLVKSNTKIYTEQIINDSERSGDIQKAINLRYF